MEQKLRFGLVLGMLAVHTEKNGADYEQLLRAVFYVFMDFFIVWLKIGCRNINQLCLALLEIHYRATYV